jgi:Asp-tRNA(Asn)/Glu-tRNA(Gln) amidotransferase A subunit family amidase
MLNRQTALELASGLQSRTLSATQVALACLERIEEREASIGAWSYLDREQVLAQARALDAGGVRGLLHGVPVGIKDIIATADMPTEYGSSIYAGHRPAWDAACVAAIRAAGGLVMGKTVTTEFASMHPGKTVNPHNGAHTPGGSSSGSAAGVADFMMPLALGTQTGGSLIRPASFCGVVGYKPSFGLISRHGVKPLAESLDTVGLFARCVADAGLLAGVIARRPELISIRPSRPSRVGIWRTFEWTQASQESIVAVEETARLLAESGAEVRVADMPQEVAALDDTHHTIEWFEMVDALSYELQRHSTGL